MPLAGRRAAAFGLGRSGWASARFLRDKGAEVTAFDQGPAEKFTDALADLAARDVRTLTGVQEWAELGDPDLLVVSPGVPVAHPLLQAARAAGCEVIGEIELAYRFCAAPMVAVAGTNGKGTTTTLLGEMLRAGGLRTAVAGNIGTPLVSVIEDDWQIVVAEVSSFQLETIVHFCPWAAILLNITPDHLDRHGDFAGYVAAKQRLFLNTGPDDLVVLNVDDPTVAGLRDETPGTVTTMSLADPAGNGYRDGDRLFVRLPGGEPRAICTTADLFLPGDHVAGDALCAGLVAVAAGCSPEATAQGARNWRPAEHLMAQVGVRGGVRFIDDSKATNAGSAIADIMGVAGPLWVIAGGQAKGADLSGFADALVRRTRGVFLIGEAAPALAEMVGGRLPVTLCPSLEAAVQQAHAAAASGDTVMLAPACASFDQFRGQADRGNRFAAAVRELPE